MGVRLLRGVAGKVLACGCLVGVYETYEGRIVRTIDARGVACELPDHRVRAEVADLAEELSVSSAESSSSHG